MEKTHKRYRNANITRFIGEIIVFVALFMFTLAMLGYISMVAGGASVLMLIVAIPISIIGEIVRIVLYIKIRKSEQKVGDTNA